MESDILKTTRYVIRRLAVAAATLLFLSAAIFFALHLLPGDVAQIAGGTNSSPEQIEALRESMGLNRSLPQQYGDWLARLLRADLGNSVLTGVPVASKAARAASITIPLIVLSLAVSLLIGVPIGCLAAASSKRKTAGAIHALSIAVGSFPALWFGMILIILFGRGMGFANILPASGWPLDGWKSPAAAFSSLILPVLTVGIITSAKIARFTRSGVLEYAQSDTVVMAMSSGMSGSEALRRAGLRLFAPQLVSVVGLYFAELITGVIVVEKLFKLNGAASILVTDIGNRDIAAVQSELFLLEAVFVLAGLITDLMRFALVPRSQKYACMSCGSFDFSGLQGRFRAFFRGLGNIFKVFVNICRAFGRNCRTVFRAFGGFLRSLPGTVFGAEGKRFRRTAYVAFLSVLSSKKGFFCVVCLVLWIIVSFVSLFYTPYPINESDGYNAWSAPGSAHLMGTDGAGRDMLSMLMAGSSWELFIVIMTVLCSAILGIFFLYAGISFGGGTEDGKKTFAVVILDALISVPSIVVVLILNAKMGACVAVVVLACSYGYGLNISRIARPSAQSACESDYVASAKYSGVSRAGIYFSHILPACAPVIVVQLSICAGSVILAESSLTYLGLGAPSNVPTWGRSLASCVRLITVYPSTVLCPGLLVVSAVIMFNILGDCARVAADPLLNERLRSIDD